MTKAEQAHQHVIAAHPVYQETVHWTPVIAKEIIADKLGILEWLEQRRLVRGTQEARNDFLYPTVGLFLFRDQKIAVEFKLLWG